LKAAHKDLSYLTAKVSENIGLSIDARSPGRLFNSVGLVRGIGQGSMPKKRFCVSRIRKALIAFEPNIDARRE
jgi:hypothetical protein